MGEWGEKLRRQRAPPVGDAGLEVRGRDRIQVGDQRASLVGDFSDYESWKAARNQWVEPTVQAQQEWADHVASLVDGSVRTATTCNSWYVGANIPGKKRGMLVYLGGMKNFAARCKAVADKGYEGFIAR